MFAADAPPASALDQLQQGLDQAAAEDIDRLTDAALGNEITALCRAADRLQAQIARRVRAFEQHHGPVVDGSLSTVAWLRNNCRLSSWSANELVTVARQTSELPLAQAAFDAGEISYENVRIMAKTSAAVGAEAYRQGEAEMVDFGGRFSPYHFRLLNERVRHVLDPDGALDEANQSYDRRRLHLSRMFDGMFAIDGVLDAEGGACLETALEALMGPPKADDERSHWQRRADALVELARQQLDAGRLPTRGGQRPHLTLFSRAGEAGELDWAGLVPAETVSRLECDCSLTEIKVDSAGKVLEVGRAKRTISPSTRRGLIARDRGCRFPGCDRPWHWTDGHHLRRRKEGGSDKLENMALFCRRHHRLFHEGGWRAAWSPDGQLVVIPP
jgi:hypothetical protein